MQRIAIALFILIIASPVLAQFETTDVHVIAIPRTFDGVTAAEFRIDNLPDGDVLMTESWNSILTIGSLGYGFAIAFEEVQEGPLIHLGTLSFVAFAPVGNDHVMELMPSNSSGGLYIVDGNYETQDACGGLHTFNCTTGDCECYALSNWCSEEPTIGLFADLEATLCHQDLLVETTPADDRSLSNIKSLY